MGAACPPAPVQICLGEAVSFFQIARRSSADNGISAKSSSPLSVLQLVFILDLTIAFKPTAKHLESYY